MQEIIAEENVKKYFSGMQKKIEGQIKVAEKAKQKGIDPIDAVETLPATDLAERTETIAGPKGVAKRYRELISGEPERIKVIFQIFKEILEGKWVEIPSEEKRLEQAIKTCLMLNTEGVVVAPIDGVPEVKISKNFDGSTYVDIYYAGPIRAAGGTSTVLPLILGDYARQLLSLDRYKPTEDEIERYIEETSLYDQIVSRQYRVKADEVRKIIKGCPVCINGHPTEEKEVAVHRDLERIPTNRIRGGACLVISEGIALKARKILTFAKMLELDWSWLENIIKFEKHEERKEIEENYKYLDGLAAGRPIFCYPSKPGGFRLRYGRSRGGGIMGKSIHPATMYLLNEFPAIGTQLKIERPGKAAGVMACNRIEAPVVLLKNGSVRKVESVEEFKEIEIQVKEILFLGDMLISYGDFRHSAHPLIPAGYCEEWWKQEVKKLGNKELLKEIEGEISGKKAIELSEKYNIPLHPKYARFYSLLGKEEVIELLKAVQNAEVEKKDGEVIKCVLENEEELKGLLEKILVEHKLEEDKIVIEGGIVYPFLKVFGGLEKVDLKGLEKKEETLDILRKVSGIKLRKKTGTFIGARMGRPESSSPRKMKGNPQVLFPIGNYGGAIRSLNKAAEKKMVEVEVALHKCQKCKKITHHVLCPECNQRTVRINQCIKCGKETLGEKCAFCGEETRGFTKTRIDLETELINATERLKIKTPKLVKGIKGLISENKIVEPLEKGLLRSKHELHIFRDGTIRYELINNALTHFKPREIKASIEKLKELGYEKDVDGEELKDEGQVLELLPQDIIIHEEAGDYFVKVTQFVDEELERLYGMEKVYGIQNREELIGELVLGLAPHTSAAIVGRILGYTEARGCFAHPYFHQAKRRNCDGEQDSLTLLMDALLNFSQEYLPASRGGRMDAPLVFTTALKPSEIDDEVHKMESCREYPLELYEKALEFASPEIEGIETIANRLGKKEQYSGLKYSHETEDFAGGPKYSKYVQLKTMEEKMNLQAELQKKIAAVNTKDSIERVLASHLLPDCIGNVRSFSKQKFRCTNCNAKYRRIPLNGKCSNCSKGHIILTIAHGSVIKYLEIAKQIIRKYELSDYLQQRIDLVEREIKSIFENKQEEQKSLSDFM